MLTTKKTYILFGMLLFVIIIIFIFSFINKKIITSNLTDDISEISTNVSTGDYIYLFSPSTYANEESLPDDLNSILFISDVKDKFKKSILLKEPYYYMTSFDSVIYFGGQEGQNLNPFCLSAIDYTEIDCEEKLENKSVIALFENGMKISNNGIYKEFFPELNFKYKDHEFFVTGIMQNSNFSPY